MYSYAPNLGHPDDHERRNQKIAKRQETGQWA